MAVLAITVANGVSAPSQGMSIQRSATASAAMVIAPPYLAVADMLRAVTGWLGMRARSLVGRE